MEKKLSMIHLLGESPSSRRPPVCSFQAAYALPGASCAGINDQGLRLGIFAEVLRFDSPELKSMEFFLRKNSKA